MRDVSRRSLAVILLAIVSVGTPAAAQTPSVASGFREHVLGDGNGLKVVAWVRSEASFADDDWLQIEIINSGPAGVIKSAVVTAPAESNGPFNSSNMLGSLTLGVPAGRRTSGSVGNTLSTGPSLTREPGTVAGARLGMRAASIDVTMRLSLSLDLIDGRSFSMAAPALIRFRWLPPTDTQMAALRKQAVALLERAIPGESALSAVEVEKLRALIQTLPTAQDVTLELALDAIRQRQIEGSFRFSEVTALVFRRWPTDPKVIAFYSEALGTRGPEAVSDLAQFAVTPWDDSFVRPVVTLIETAGPREWIVLSRGLTLMDRHYASWSQDPSIAPRLSRAVLRFQPASMPNGMYNWVDMLALTHDRGMIAVLRPFLSDKTIDQYTSVSANMPLGVTPMRYSELAANSICRLLGEPIMFDPWKRAAATPLDGRYPEWEEWDRKIAALRQRLATMLGEIRRKRS